MNDGTIITVPDLIALKKHVSRQRHAARTMAKQTGHRETRLRGRGMDFAEVRNYQPGDEIRHMEWRSTARTGRAHIKLYQEERERPVILWVDFNASMHFGTRGQFKSVLAAQLAALIAWIAVIEGDRVGGFFFSGAHHDARMPKSLHKGVLPLLSNLAHYTQTLHKAPDTPPKPFNEALLQVKPILKPGSLLILISDFYSIDPTSTPLLNRFKKQHDVIAYHIADTLELAAPKAGLYPISNGKETRYLDLRTKRARVEYTKTLAMRAEMIQSCFKQSNTPYFSITNETDWIALAHHSFPRSRHG